MRRHGFTLIELLVVIAIIAILAAILFPVFAKAREKARQSSCQSNLKQMATAMLMYINDYDEIAPKWDYETPGVNTPYPGGQFGGKQDQWMDFPELLEPYCKNYHVFQCPSNFDRECANYYVPMWRSNISYGMNWALPNCMGSGPEFPTARMQRSAQVAMYLETGPAGPNVYTRNVWTWGLHGWGNVPVSFNWCVPWCWWPYKYNAPHNDMMNVACWDGHVKAVKPVIGEDMNAGSLPDPFEVGGGIYWDDRP